MESLAEAMENVVLRPDDDSFFSSAASKVEKGLLPSLKLDDDRPFQDEDFQAHRPISLAAMTSCAQSLNELIEADRQEILKRNDVAKTIVVKVILLCGENVDASYPWVTVDHVSAAYKVLNLIKKAMKCDSVSKLLLEVWGDNLLRWSLEQMRDKLEDKHVCRNHPGVQACFVWLLNHLTRPNLSSYLSEFFPYTLRFIDDWEIRNKMIGLQCLSHIIDNVTSTELSWYGRLDIITESLYKTLVGHQDLDLIGRACQTWYLLLDKVERNECSRKPNKWDDLAKHFLYKMEMATTFDQKLFYARQIMTLLRGLKVSVVRWLTSILRITSSYLEVGDGDEERLRLQMVDVLIFIVDSFKDRAEFHLKTILDVTVRILFEITMKKERTKGEKELLKKFRDLFVTSARQFPKKFKHLCHGMNEVKVNPDFDAAVTEAFQEITAASDDS